MIIEALKEVCDELGIEYRSYSGRGMYGKRCFAIFAEDAMAAVVSIAWELGRRDEDPSRLESIKSDSLGLDTVVYWPRIEWRDSGEDTEE